MLILPGPSILPEIAPNLSADLSPVGAREGLHLSEIIHYYLVNKKGVALGGYGQFDQWSSQVIECGWVWERLLAMLAVERQDVWGLVYQEAWKHRRLEIDRLHGKQIMQAHLELDGVRMTPDGLDVTGPAPVLLEDKHTRKSSKKSGFDIETDLPIAHDAKGFSGGFVENFIGWLLQMSGYAHAWSVRLGEPVLSARLRVFWAGGDYSWQEGRGAQGKCYLLTFTEDELRATWRMILELATEMLRAKMSIVGQDSAPSAV
jgi:hypothetical protein